MNWSALAAVLLWGASFVVSKIALAELLPLHLILLRTILAALALDLLLLQRSDWRDIVRLTRRDWARIGLLTLISVFPHQLAQMSGLRQTTAINGALLITLAPLFMFALSAIFEAEPVTWPKVIAFLIAVIGSTLVITRGNLRALSLSGQTMGGDLLIVVSAGGWALYSMLGKNLLQKRSPLLIVALVFSLSLPVLAVSAAFNTQSLASVLSGISLRAWGAVLFLAWGCSALAYVLWYKALQEQEISRVSVFQYLQPMAAALLGLFLLDESLVWATVIGGGMILSGVALANRRRR